jgi:hypothetical protein
MGSRDCETLHQSMGLDLRVEPGLQLESAHP